MARWITADWHLGEDRWTIMQRPGFNDAQNMVDQLVTLHNELVAPDDVVLVVGDIVNLKTPEYLKQIERFNGRKTLFRGNHDKVFTDADIAPYFDRVTIEGAGEVHIIDGVEYWITHYPTQARPDMFNLVGHIHAAWKFQLNAINVGVDTNHFRPHNMDVDIPFLRQAIIEHYDDDVWAAYDASNIKYLNVRGKAGRYLDAED